MIPIDAVYPDKRVNYVVGNARVGQRTRLRQTYMEVWDRRQHQAGDAVAYGAKILKEQMNMFIALMRTVNRIRPQDGFAGQAPVQ